MEELIVKTQEELDAVPVDYNGRIVIKFGTRLKPAILRKKYKYPAVLWESSSAELRGSSSAVLWGNAQALDRSINHNIKTSGNARIVYDPRNIDEYIDQNGLEATDSTVLLYKAVHKRDGRYWADWTYFEYRIGETAEADSLTTDVNEDCGHGIHMAHEAWCVDYGREWSDLAILELEVEKSGVIVPLGGAGKVRAAKAKVIREVPLEECGLYGEWLAKRRK